MAASAYIIAKAALQPGIEAIQVAVVGVRFFGLSRGILRYLERLTAHNAAFKILADLRVWFYRSLEPLAPARLLTYHSGDLLTRILHDVETLQNLFVRGIAPVGTALLSSLAAGWFLAIFYPPLALTLWLFLLLAGVALPILLRRVTQNTAANLQSQRARLTALLIDHLRGLPDLLAFNAHGAHLARCEQASQQLGALQSRMAYWGAFQSGALVLLSNLAMSAVLWQSLPLVQSGQLDGVFLAALALSALASFEAVQTLPLAATHLESSLEAMRRLLEVVAPAKSAALPEILPPLELHAPPRLAVRDLTFGYPGSSRAALHRVTFNLRQGEHLAVVGASGAGKSTLTQILLRFWDSYSGGVYLDGREIRTLDAETVRAAFAVVSPQTHLFYASIRENLLLARPHATPAEVESACRAAQLHDWIMSLPDGYETLIGEGGARLSGGERQRLALARALLKDAPILILDEATAHLDARTEDALLTALHGRTVLRITHRPRSLAAADKILHLHNGQVVKY